MKKFLLPLFVLVGFTFPSSGSAEPARVLFLIGEKEYGTRTSLPTFAKSWLPSNQFCPTFIFAKSDDRASLDCHRFPGLAAALKRADILVISTRRRYPSQSNMTAIRAWVAAGKPIIGLRTACHGFGERSKGNGYLAPPGHAAWNTFDQDVFGATYTGHHRPNSEGRLFFSAGLKASALTKDISMQPQPLLSHLYQFEKLDPKISPILFGEVTGITKKEPVAWSFSNGKQRSYFLSLGSEEDFALGLTSVLLRNMIVHASL